MSYQEETKEHLEAVKIVEERSIGKVMKLQSENDRLRKANEELVKTLNTVIEWLDRTGPSEFIDVSKLRQALQSSESDK